MKIYNTPHAEHEIDNITTQIDKHGSFKTTIPMKLAKQLKLESGDILSWSTRKENGKQYLQLTKK